MFDFSAQAKDTVRQWAQGKHGHYRRTCPDCSPSRAHNRTAQCLSVTVFAEHLVMKCHHCERTGATKLFTDEPKRFVPPPSPPPAPKGKCVKRLDIGLTEAAIAFLTSRHISLKTAQVAACVSARAYFLNIRAEDEAIAFPYGKNHKFRALSQKDHVVDGPFASLFMQDLVDLTEGEDIIIAEGELDALSFYEASVVNSTSVPNGASSFQRVNEDGSPRELMGFLWEAKDLIEKAKRILIATDNDEPGDKLAEELARRIGRHRCWRIKYPEGCKDANDVLVKFGKEAVQNLVQTAEPWPVTGLYEADHYFEDYDRIFSEGFGERIITGINVLDEYFSVAPGMLTVVTGSPNAGKSNLVNQIVLNLARRYGYITAMCSFETPPPLHLGQLAEMLIQKHFFETATYGERMTREEMESVKPFLLRHVKFLSQEDGGKADVESIIERVKAAVFRWGVKIVVIDPYSYINRPSNADSETAFITDMLTRIRMMARHYDIHVFFIAHPSKPNINADGTTAVPKGYSISGSAAWFNHPDHGLSVHRVPDSHDVEVHIWKTRFSWLGQNGVARFFYDQQRHLYHSDEWVTSTPYGVDDDEAWYDNG